MYGSTPFYVIGSIAASATAVATIDAGTMDHWLGAAVGITSMVCLLGLAAGLLALGITRVVSR